MRETVRKCEKIRQNDCKTFFMTSDSQKMTSRFLDSYFCTKFRISQTGWYPDRAIKIRHVLWKALDVEYMIIEGNSWRWCVFPYTQGAFHKELANVIFVQKSLPTYFPLLAEINFGQSTSFSPSINFFLNFLSQKIEYVFHNLNLQTIYSHRSTKKY